MALTQKTITQTAIQMVIMDILEKNPETEQDYLIQYMKTLAFENQVRGYIRMLRTL